MIVGQGMNMLRFAVRVVHIPTGIEVVFDSTCHRSERKAYEAAIKYLRSRLWAIGYDKSKMEIEYFKVGGTGDINE